MMSRAVGRDGLRLAQVDPELHSNPPALVLIARVLVPTIARLASIFVLQFGVYLSPASWDMSWC